MLRTPLVLLFGSLIAACTVGDPGTGGDDDTIPPNCGNGVVDPGEQCDGGANCTADCKMMQSNTPKLDIRVDKPTVSTELRSTNMVTATLTASGGFGGPVNLTASVVDANGALIPSWTVALNNQSVTVPVDGTIDVVASVTIPSENKGLTGTLKINATPASGPAAQVASSLITALNQVSLPVTMDGNGLCVYTAVQGQTKVAVGTKVRMVNKGTATMIFHSDGGAAGIPHEDTTTNIAINGSYDHNITAVTGAFNWYCHSPGPNPGNGVQILPVAAP